MREREREREEKHTKALVNELPATGPRPSNEFSRLRTCSCGVYGLGKGLGVCYWNIGDVRMVCRSIP